MSPAVLKHFQRRTDFLLHLDDSLRPLTDPEEITQTAARLLGEHMGVNRCAYADVESDEDTFNLTGDYTDGVSSIIGRYTFTQFGADCLRLMREGRPYVVEDSETDSRTEAARESYRQTQIRSVICVSLLKHGRFVAAMAVHQATPRRWLSDEVGLVQQVASRCWESIERMRVTRELFESEGRFRQLADEMPQLAWMANPDGAVFWYNRRWYDYTGATPKQTEGWGWRSFHDPKTLPSVSEQWRHSIESGQPFEMTFPLKRSDDVFRLFLTRVIPLRNEAGAIVRWFGTATDVTTQIEAEKKLLQQAEELWRSNRELEQFAYVSSHDLQEPLRKVSTYAQMLSQKYGEKFGPEADHYLKNIEVGAMRMQSLIRDLLSFSRLGKDEGLPDASVDLAEVARGVVDDLEATLNAASAKVVIGKLPTVRGNAVRLSQVFQNLIGNAVKFHGAAAPKVALSAAEKGRDWIISVKDNGIGMDPKYSEQIFNVFQRLHGTRKFEGTGIGLAICKKIIEQHGGKIWANSRPGKGSTFYFTLRREP